MQPSQCSRGEMDPPEAEVLHLPAQLPRGVEGYQGVEPHQIHVLHGEPFLQAHWPKAHGTGDLHRVDQAWELVPLGGSSEGSAQPVSPLAYAHALQHMGEAMEGQHWHPSSKLLSAKVLGLVDAFIMAMGAEFVEMDMALCWNQREGATATQIRDCPFANIIAFLNEYARQQPLGCEWDESVHPLPLVPCDTPCCSCHLGHVLGQILDAGNTMPVYQFHVTKPGGELVGVGRGLIYEGYLLVYDMQYCW